MLSLQCLGLIIYKLGLCFWLSAQIHREDGGERTIFIELEGIKFRGSVHTIMYACTSGCISIMPQQLCALHPCMKKHTAETVRCAVFFFAHRKNLAWAFYHWCYFSA